MTSLRLMQTVTSGSGFRRLATEPKGHPDAHFTAHLLNAMGSRTQVSPEGPDRGIDIVAHKEPLGLEPRIIKVPCKSAEGKVGSPQVSGLLGTAAHNRLFVTLGRFSPEAVNLGRVEHYDAFGAEYEAKLPIRRLYFRDAPAA